MIKGPFQQEDVSKANLSVAGYLKWMLMDPKWNVCPTNNSEWLKHSICINKKINWKIKSTLKQHQWTRIFFPKA